MSAESVAQVSNYWTDSKKYHQPFYDGIGPDLAFGWDQHHYAQVEDKDPNRLQPSDPSLTNLLRYKLSEIFRAAQNADIRGNDTAGDQFTAAAWKGLLNQWENDPENQVLENLEEVLLGGLATGAWGCEVGFDRECGQFGEVYLESQDPRRYFPQPGFHRSKRSRWLVIQKDLLPEEIEAKEKDGWTDVKGVQPDKDSATALTTEWRNLLPEPSATDPQFVTVLFSWERYLKETKKRVSYRKLHKDQWKMKCMACGYAGMNQETLARMVPDFKGLPVMGSPTDPASMCTMCGSFYTQRIEAEALEPDELANRYGRRLRIVAPYAGREFYSDAWPWDKVTGFVNSIWTPYGHPLKSIPNGDTAYYRSLICVLNAMWRLGYEQQRKAHGIILSPDDGIHDAMGQDFAYSEYQDVAYYDPEVLRGLGPGAIQWFQPPGLNSGWPAYIGAVQSLFASTKGTGDIPFPADRSRDIAASALQIMVETGDRAIDQHIRRFQRWLSLTKTRVLQLMQSTYTDERMAYVLGPDGQGKMQAIRAAALPGADVLVTNEPTIKQNAEAEIRAIQLVMGFPPPWRKMVAKRAGIDPMELAQIEEEERQMQEDALAAGKVPGQQTQPTQTQNANPQKPPQNTGVVQ